MNSQKEENIYLQSSFLKTLQYLKKKKQKQNHTYYVGVECYLENLALTSSTKLRFTCLLQRPRLTLVKRCTTFLLADRTLVSVFYINPILVHLLLF